MKARDITGRKFRKEERLSSRKSIDLLFAGGASASRYPLKLVFMKASMPQPFPSQVMFVVPKRSFRKAHDRNRIRRRMREAYRLSKETFYAALAEGNAAVIMAFIYTSNKEESYAKISESVKAHLSLLPVKLSK